MPRIAMVGAGGIAAAHLENLSRIPGVTLAGVAARSEERAGPLARRFGLKPYGHWRALLDAEQPDAVWVCVTPASHGELEHELCARKLPFFVEKPLATDWATAAEIAERVDRAGLMTSVGYHWRYHRQVERAKQALAGHKPMLAQGYYLTRTPPPAWWSSQASSGGQLLEQTTHIVDLARSFLGEARTVYAASARVDRASHPTQDVDQVGSVLVTFASGAIATFSSSCLLAATHRVGLNLFAEGLAVEIGLHDVSVDDGTERTVLKTDGEALLREAQAFVSALVSGDRGGIRSTYADALKTHRVTTLAVESARLGKVLEVG